MLRRFTYNRYTHPRRGDLVGGDTPLTPLFNVGRYLPEGTANGQTECSAVGFFAEKAHRALYSLDFFRCEILADPELDELSRSEAPPGEALDSRPRDAKKYRKQIIEQLASPPADESGVVLQKLTTDAHAYARYFAVLKDLATPGEAGSVDTGRGIFDCRVFNARSRPPPFFELVYPELVLRLIAGLGTRRVVFYSADLRNFYTIKWRSRTL